MVGQLVYREGELFFPSDPPTTLVEFSSAHEQKRWAEGSDAYGLVAVDAQADDASAEADDGLSDGDDDMDATDVKGGDDRPRRSYSRHVSLLVTPDHDMYAQLGNSNYEGQFVATCERRGYQKGKPLPPALTVAPSKMLASSLLNAPNERACARLLACASLGHTPERASALAVQRVRDALQLTTEEMFRAFLEVFGFWLGDGSMAYSRSNGRPSAVTFARVKAVDIKFLDDTLPKTGLTTVRRREYKLKRADRRRKVIVVWRIVDRRWCEFFDAEFGVKYTRSRFFDAQQALLRQHRGLLPSSSDCIACSHAISSADSIASRTRSSSDSDSSSSGIGVGLYSMDCDAEVVQCATPGCGADSYGPLCAACMAGTCVRASCTRSKAMHWAADDDEDEPHSPSADAVQSAAEYSELSSESEVDEQSLREPVKEEKDEPMKHEPLDDDATMDEEEEEEEEEPPVDPDDPERPTASAKWLPHWAIMHLSPELLQLLLDGVYQADGSYAGQTNVIYTSGVVFRDQLIQALLHCGCTAWSRLQQPAGEIRGYHWHDQSADSTVYTLGEYAQLSPADQVNYKPIRSTVNQWIVEWSKPQSTGKAACWPLIRRQQGVKSVAYSENDHGRIWCVNVHHPDHLIVAQRAQRDPKTAIVNKQARPIIVGQCIFSNDNASKLVLQIRFKADELDKGAEGADDVQDDDIFLKKVEENLLNTMELRGIKGITKVFMREEKKSKWLPSGQYDSSEQMVSNIQRRAPVRAAVLDMHSRASTAHDLTAVRLLLACGCLLAVVT